MASSEADSRLERVLVPALEKIIKNGSWRKHSKLSAECKSVIENLTLHKQCPIEAPTSDQADSEVLSLPGVLLDQSLYESEFFLSPLINALSANYVRVAEPALDAVQKLMAHGYLHGEADSSEGPASKLLSRLIYSTCKCHDLGDENVELLVIKTLLTAVTSCALRIHGDCLLQVVKTCYHIYIISKNMVNQTTAKASLVQMLVIVFRRMEADSSTVPLQPIVVAELMEPLEKADADGSTAVFVQGFITKIMQDIDGVFSPSTPSGGRVSGVALHDGAFDTKAPSVEGTTPADLLDSTDKDMLDAKYWEISMYKTALEERKGELADGEGERDDDLEVQIGNMLKRDAFLVFRALCKLMADPQVMKGKILALELLKILLENAGAIFRTSERFLDAIKQYLCLSLLKNSASTLMIIFQLSCSIFISLVSRFRAGLKAEIGVFFPMIVLRVLENVSQPNFQQKMTVLRFLEKLCDDSQILIDIFLNYDCDVNASNIFERMVNGLLKTAQGVPPGLATTLQPPQDGTMKLEALRCLVAILKCMGDWMKKQLRIPDSHSKKFEVVDNSSDPVSVHLVNGNGDEPTDASYAHPEASEVSDISKIEQRRAYKLELQEGISLFNRKPKKDLPLKVMHAYVDSFDFEDMEFDDAIRKLLEGFRLPGEAQKIDRIMEKFAERYCKCNPEDFISADTAYVLAYSVIMLNTDAHNPMVKNKMSAEDFIRNNQGIDDGKDLPEEYMRSLFERITKNEIKMKEDNFSIQQKQSVNSNRVLGLDSILNIVIRKPGGDNMETGDDLMKHMQEQFKEKARKSEHQNMNRIRLVWSKIWEVLSDFFVTIGCSENLSIAIFGIDSLRQLSMKFLEREELANYNFQNEVMKPFVIVMRKSGAVEIRELIIRCVSQMVLSRVNNVKSGWKSMFMAIMEIYDMHRAQLCAKNTVILFEAVHSVAFHAHKINSDDSLRQKLQERGSLTQMQDPPLLRLENESFQICLTFLQNLVLDRPPRYEESEVESYLVNLCQEVLQSYIEVACSVPMPDSSLDRQRLRMIPLGSGRRRELTTRAPLVVAALHTICCLEDSSLQKCLSGFFPLLAHLISCEHGSNEVQLALSDMLSSSVGPVLQRSC
ncbi:UNVERIFIED_CONTAM: Brefeldin A-inhibited guanine nucleotide-exchange protein 2 [Sesamum latifolium]|uniref:Brefeldin A-inhibited guanine nucleotide-exchange protein 2 n=1 Tax=Sesamum latifolium TaxID=2727402 RepID=A0AAW2U3L8_9LAMI